jgi:hypothetical protein
MRPARCHLQTGRNGFPGRASVLGIANKYTSTKCYSLQQYNQQHALTSRVRARVALSCCRAREVEMGRRSGGGKANQLHAREVELEMAAPLSRTAARVAGEPKSFNRSRHAIHARVCAGGLWMEGQTGTHPAGQAARHALAAGDSINRADQAGKNGGRPHTATQSTTPLHRPTRLAERASSAWAWTSEGVA